MALPLEDVLSLWRELERVRDTLPADSPEGRAIAIEISRMRTLYRRMAARRTESEAKLRLSIDVVDGARQVLARARARTVGGPLAPLDAPTEDSGPRLSTFPAQDEAFALRVQTTRARLRSDGRDVTPESLEAALRRFHTRAIVRRRNPLATLGHDVWYVYRDGHAGVRVLDDWWQCDDCATVVFDRTGAFVQADDAACELVGVSPGGLAGRRWQEFVRSRAPRADGAALWDLLEAHGSLQSVFDVPLPGGGFRVIEYHSAPTEDPDRFTSRWRAIAEIPPDGAKPAGEEMPAGEG